MDPPRRILIAGLFRVMREVNEVLANDFVIISAETLQEAQRQFEDALPDCVLVAYHFDEARPFRLIRHIRDHPRGKETPIILVSVLGFNLGATEEEVRSAYQDVGVTQFWNLHQDAKQYGREEALNRLRSVCARFCALSPVTA